MARSRSTFRILLLCAGLGAIACGDDGTGGGGTAGENTGASGAGGATGGAPQGGSGGTGAVGGSGAGAAGAGGATGGGGDGGGGGPSSDPGSPGQSFVSAGSVATSPSYRVVFTMGQSSQGQQSMASPSYQLQGGLIGATESLQ